MSGKTKNRAGFKCHKLTFISQTKEKSSSGNFKWECLCDCGNTTIVNPGNVMRSTRPTTSCGCHYKKVVGTFNTIDESGKKYGKLLFIEPTDRRESHKVIWKIQCDCGNIIYKTPYAIKKGNQQSCGCLKQTMFECGIGFARKYEPIISSARIVWMSSYKDGCSFEQFYELSQKKCYYCGSKPHRTYNVSSTKHSSKYQKDFGDFTYNGLDRIDSNLSHVSSNVVTCCYTCNTMKMAMGQDDFIKHIRKIYANTISLYPEQTI
jgi:hypothetical protein